MKNTKYITNPTAAFNDFKSVVESVSGAPFSLKAVAIAYGCMANQRALFVILGGIGFVSYNALKMAGTEPGRYKDLKAKKPSISEAIKYLYNQPGETLTSFWFNLRSTSFSTKLSLGVTTLGMAAYGGMKAFGASEGYKSMALAPVLTVLLVSALYTKYIKGLKSPVGMEFKLNWGDEGKSEKPDEGKLENSSVRELLEPAILRASKLERENAAFREVITDLLSKIETAGYDDDKRPMFRANLASFKGLAKTANHCFDSKTQKFFEITVKRQKDEEHDSGNTDRQPVYQ